MAWAFLWLGIPVFAEIAPPDYSWAILESVYPSGAQAGTEVRVEFRVSEGGAEGATDILVEGEPGLIVSDVEAKKDMVEATLTIAPDAEPGRRMVRVRGGKGGLTNFRWFVVGSMPESIENEKNNTPEEAESVETPLIINGRIQAPVDQDCYGFSAKKGQRIVAAINAHGLDAMGFGRDDRGYVDLSLELLDAQGKTLVSTGDTVGFDPIVEHKVPADGEYVVRVSGLGYRGFPQAVYRLTLGEIGYATAVFPGGGKCGVETLVELSGPGLSKPAKEKMIAADASHPVAYLEPQDNLVPHDLAWVVGTLDESLEVEPNNARDRPSVVPFPGTANGRFLEEGDEDWYRLSLKENQKVALEIVAQQHLRSPVDTRIEVYNAEGELLQANDDGAIYEGETTHDFVAFDSYATFTAKKAGDYFVCVTEQTGASGSRTVYRLSATESKPDMRLYQWPDAVPVWGAGSTASFAVEVIRLGGLEADIELSVEGLPEGWSGSAGFSDFADYRGPRQALGTKALLTITAPPDAKVGDLAEFYVVGRAKTEDGKIERRAQALTLYAYGDPHRFRVSPISRAAVAPSTGPWLSTEVSELKAKPGDELKIPVTWHDETGKGEDGQMVINIGRSHHIANFGTPVGVKGGAGELEMPLSIPDGFNAGVYGIVVSRQWGSNFRGGLPGPCTALIRLEVADE